MNQLKFKQLAVSIGIISISLVSGGCRPTTREIAEVVSTIPIGASRDELRKVLMDAYSKKFPKEKDTYALIGPPQQVTQKWIQVDKNLLTVATKQGSYAVVHPADLFNKMAVGSLCDTIGLGVEASHGNGFLSIYYDKKTNYIGFFATCTAKRK